ncbi:unnamed protein product [Ectocarpus fasciculatus]
MPRLDRMGLDERTLGVLASLPVPIVLAESLLSRDPEQVALECGVSMKAVSKLRYLVALRCQPQPPVPDRRAPEDNDDGTTPNTQRHGGEGKRGAGSSAATPPPRPSTAGARATSSPRQIGGLAGGVGGGGTPDDPPLLSFASADALYRQAREVGGFVTTGSDSLDSLLCKGLMLHHVVEVVGRSSSGKTQLCLTAAVAAASHGIGVLYIDTANGCSVRRMQQIARSRYADANGEMTARQMDALLDRLRVVRAFDVSRVMSALVAYIDGVMEGGRDGVYSDCRLVILDSVTAVISPLLGGVKNPAGHGLMASLGHLLNRAASQCSACVLVANSTVAPRWINEEEGPRAALGLTWEGVPSIRVLLAENSTAAGGASGSGDAGGAGHGAVSGASPRTATLLKHPAQARNNKTWQPRLRPRSHVIFTLFFVTPRELALGKQMMLRVHAIAKVHKHASRRKG